METEDFCAGCFRKSNWAKAEKFSPYIQRLTCYGQQNWLTIEGAKQTDQFLNNWLTNFGSSMDRNLLFFFFHAHLGKYKLKKQTPSLDELKGFLSQANLPLGSSEKVKLRILRAWLPDFEEAIKLDLYETGQHDYGDLLKERANRRLLWGFDGQELRSLGDLRRQLLMTTQEMSVELSMSKSLVGILDGFPRTNHLNYTRDYALMQSANR